MKRKAGRVDRNDVKARAAAMRQKKAAAEAAKQKAAAAEEAKRQRSMMPPPPQPCIVAQSGETHTLPRWWDMTHQEPGYGEVYDVKGLLRHFGLSQADEI